MIKNNYRLLRQAGLTALWAYQEASRLASFDVEVLYVGPGWARLAGTSVGAVGYTRTYL